MKIYVKKTSLYISLPNNLCDRVPRHRCSDTGGGNATRWLRISEGV